MATYARVDGSTVLEYRDIDGEIPPHKAHIWRPVFDEGSGPIKTTTVETDRVRRISSERPLDVIKAELLVLVDADAERIRMRHLTPGAGMAMTYAEKRDQANAVHAMGEAAANALTEAERIAQFPTLAATVGLEAPTLWAVSQIVLSKSESFVDLTYPIERTKWLGKKAISDAPDAASARAAYEAITWK